MSHTILIADDSTCIREALCNFLERGMTLTFARRQKTEKGGSGEGSEITP